MPEGPLRLTLTLAALFVVPGYLLLQAVFLPGARARLPALTAPGSASTASGPASTAYGMEPSASAAAATTATAPAFVQGPPPLASSRVLHLVVSLGLSPAIVALLALSTAAFGQFQTGPIIVAIAGGSLAMAAIAVVRRLKFARKTGQPVPATSSAPEPVGA